jgi:hypothetical protein
MNKFSINVSFKTTATSRFNNIRLIISQMIIIHVGYSKWFVENHLQVGKVREALMAFYNFFVSYDIRKVLLKAIFTIENIIV